MIVHTLLCGFILFTAAFVSKAEDDTPKVFTLETAVNKFVRVFEQVYNVKVDWTDLNSERKEMQALFATKKFQVNVERGPIKIGETKTSSSTRTPLYANLYDNQANASQTYTVTHTTIRKEKSSYMTKLGFSIGTELSGGLTFEETLGLSGSFGIKTDRETAQTDTKTKLKMFSVAMGVTVPPNRTVQVEWYTTTSQKEFIWTCNVTISGYFAMKLTTKLDNTDLLIIPVRYLVLANKELEAVGPRHARFVASGVFTAITVPESDIYTSDVTDTLKDKITMISERSWIVG
uniref:Putative cytotoxin-like protein n=1 Tax=Ixodes ricinus TaxID=34613 RepID=A0A147BUX1_IXORI